MTDEIKMRLTECDDAVYTEIEWLEHVLLELQSPDDRQQVVEILSHLNHARDGITQWLNE